MPTPIAAIIATSRDRRVFQERLRPAAARQPSDMPRNAARRTVFVKNVR
jgi:hypothetical protein